MEAHGVSDTGFVRILVHYLRPFPVSSGACKCQASDGTRLPADHSGIIRRPSFRSAAAIPLRSALVTACLARTFGHTSP